LQNPLIASADLHGTINAFGSEISWATFPANFSHPMFEIGARRVDASLGQGLSGQEFMKACFANFTANNAAEFVRSTWSKPRDMVRFLRTAKNMYPDAVTLSKTQYSSVFHAAAITARTEIEVALTSFLSTSALQKLLDSFSKRSSESLENGNIETVPEFERQLSAILKSEKGSSFTYDASQFFRLLYILGVVQTVRKSKTGELIQHSYHRGQVNPDFTGNVAIHRCIAKSYS
jgi:hypothetical protein